MKHLKILILFFKSWGVLKILIVNASALYQAGTHVTVRVNDGVLSTDKVDADENPQFNETLAWGSFRPGHNKHSVIKVWSYH